MSRLWNLFRPAPPAPLEERIVPSAAAPVVDAAAIDAILAGATPAIIPTVIAKAVSGPPPPEPVTRRIDLRGEARGEVASISPAGPGRGVALVGSGPLLGDSEVSLEGSLIYDDPTRPADAPRAEGVLRLNLPEGTLHLRLESEERSGEPSLLFPRVFRFVIESSPGTSEHATGEGTASLIFYTARQRGKQPARQTFSLLLGSATR